MKKAINKIQTRLDVMTTTLEEVEGQVIQKIK